MRTSKHLFLNLTKVGCLNLFHLVTYSTHTHALLSRVLSSISPVGIEGIVPVFTELLYFLMLNFMSSSAGAVTQRMG